MSPRTTPAAKAAAGPIPRLAYNIDEAGHVSNLSREVLYKAIREAQLKARKYGSRTLVLHADLVEFLEKLPTSKEVA